MMLWYVICVLTYTIHFLTYQNNTIMKKLNLFMFIQWIIFMPLILPLGIITGAFEGVKKIFEQAAHDIQEAEQELV
jgi:predicted DNA repair protein MutK